MRWIIKKVVKTVALITALSCMERGIGFFYRIFLSRQLGAEFIGIYQVTLSVVGVLVTLTASGIPITVSRLMLREKAVGNKKGENDVVSAGIVTALLISVPCAAALYFFKGAFSFMFADQRCYDLLVIILPGITITSVYAVIRGFFWGNSYFLTYALIELLEEAVMCLAGVVLVTRAQSAWLGTLSAAKSVLISYVVSFVLSTAVFVIKSGRVTNPLYKLKPLILSSSPITAMRTLTSLAGFLVAIIIPKRLMMLGGSQTAVMEAFGELNGMAMPLLFIPSTIIGSIALVIVPKLSENFYRGNKAVVVDATDRAVDYSLLIASLIVPVFISAGGKIGEFVYDNPAAGQYLSLSAVIMLPMSFTMMTNSVLNSLNMEKRTLVNFVVGTAVMLGLMWTLPKYVGIHAMIIGYLFSYTITGTLNLVALKKIRHDLRPVLLKIGRFIGITLVTTVFSCLVGGLLKGRTSSFLFVLTVGFATLLFECGLLYATGTVDLGKLIKE
ncbi:MAG: oligosaccharide flippase family protein [Clostridia bacterium]|nr:oligosaccharide flippase family protein [Clostridia bacterium]